MVKRYRPNWNAGTNSHGVHDAVDGEFVRYSDYAALEAQLAEVGNTPAPKVTEAMVEAGCKAFLAEYGDPSAEWHHYHREVTAALIAAMESGQ